MVNDAPKFGLSIGKALVDLDLNKESLTSFEIGEIGVLQFGFEFDGFDSSQN